jgi:hypothetical protein
MKEEEISPAKIFNEYLRLALEDTDTYFGEVERKNGECPACGTKGVPAFVKHGFSYESCPNCHSQFLKPSFLLSLKKRITTLESV